MITMPLGYHELREGSPVVEHEGRLIWLGTCVKKVNNVNVFSLHRWECSVDDDENWTYRGKLSLKDGNGNDVEAEDPTFTFGTDGRIYMYVENKSYEKSHSMFVISLFIANNWNDTFWFQGGNTSIAPLGNGFMQDAVYSPFYTGQEKDTLIFDGRKGVHKEEIGYAVWDGSKYVPNPNPIFTVDHIGNNVLTTGIANAVFKLPNKYVLEIVAYKGTPPDGYWCQGLAVSDNLTSGWEVLDSEIKDELGRNTMFGLFHNGTWKALMGFLDDPNKLYMAEVITGNDYSEYINNNPMLPKHSPTVSDNVLLIREFRPLLEQWYGEALEAGNEAKMQEILYAIDLIDEIS